MTATQAAEWMLSELQRTGYLDQATAASELEKIDPVFVYMNESGGIGIKNSVLKAFNKIAPSTDYVWSRSGLHWRRRQPSDIPDRRMQY